MQVICDFHIHSYLSRATSKKMKIDEISKNGKLKGIDLIGTGDFTHPTWLNHIKRNLKDKETEKGSGIFDFNGIKWILTSEVATIYKQDGKTRKIHHVIHAPDLETAQQINSRLDDFGKLESDGRPILTGITSPELVEILMEISKDILLYPAHAWTSWYGVLGEFSGFDSIKECYKDQMKNIHALETGLSSDPQMNWRISELDDLTLLSSSDAHSPWGWRLGREVTVFNLDKLSYKNVTKAIKQNDRKKLEMTIEVEPSYGKYHFTGHRKCGINLHPNEALKRDNKCPICGKKMTVGVLQRVEKLADRPEDYNPDNRTPFKSMLPLYEIISTATGVNRLYSNPVIRKQNKLIDEFGNEFNVLLNTPKEDLLKITNEKIADAIIKTREGDVKYIPGYDGVYGVPVFSDERYQKLKKEQISKAKEQKNLRDFSK